MINASRNLNFTNNLKIIKMNKPEVRTISNMSKKIERNDLDPNLKVLNEIDDIEGINIKLLLKTVNKRIQLEQGRSHIISHGYFTSLVGKQKNEAKNELGVIFKNRIIPLLQKYFNNDWEKIRLVLGDDKKIDDNEKYQFIKTKEKNYSINVEAFSNINSYLKIYK